MTREARPASFYQAIVTTVASAAVLLVACSAPDPVTEEVSVQTDEEQILAEDGSVLLDIADVPGTVPVDQHSEFGAAERIREASLSPDNGWLAVVTTGVAHSAGWLIREGSREPKPAAFQYGGSIAIGPWSEDGQRVVFEQEGPGGDQALTVVDRARLGDTVEASAMPVRSPDHDQHEPEERIYEVLGWHNGSLLFRVGGERWVFDPDRGDVEPADKDFR